MSFCRECGSPLKPEQQFCIQCGTEKKAPTPSNTEPEQPPKLEVVPYPASEHQTVSTGRQSSMSKGKKVLLTN